MNQHAKRVLNQQGETPRSETLRLKEHTEQTVKTFDTLVDFLRDSNRFPNKEINKLITLAWRLIGNQHITTAIDQSVSLKSLRFQAETQDNKIRTPLCIIPKNFIDLVSEDTTMQLGGITSMTSCR